MRKYQTMTGLSYLKGCQTTPAKNLTTFSFIGKTMHAFNLLVVWPNDKPWYDSKLRHFTSARDKLKRKLITSTSLHLLEQYRKFCDKVNNLIKTLNYNTPPLSCRGQITLSNMNEICPLTIPDQISTISNHVPSLVKIP